MKKLLPLLITLALNTLFTLVCDAQKTVNSTDGYSVTITIQPVALVPSTTSNCQYGYNYNIKLNYSITASGNYQDGILYDINGGIGCGSQRLTFQLPTHVGSGTITTSVNPWTTRTDCATATLTSMNCITVTASIIGRNMNAYNFSVPQSIVLPVKLSDFNVNLNANNAVDLKWSTTSEQNSDFFSIERSANGTDWSAIGRLKASGNSNSVVTYKYSDAAPISGTSYYRLRQVDQDGASVYTEIKTIRNMISASKISLFPIPNNGNKITITGVTEFTNYHLTLLNAGGTNLFATNLSGASVDLPKIAPGFYFIRVTDKTTGAVTNIRYVKN